MDNSKSPVCTIKAGSIYQHYKGDKYKIITVSCCSETLGWVVVYQALYDNNVSVIWHRPLDMFLGVVENNGQNVPRFSCVEQIAE